MNISSVNEVCTVFSVEVVHVSNVLEIVSIDLAVFNGSVRHYVVSVFLYYEVYALRSKSVLKGVKDLSVR